MNYNNWNLFYKYQNRQRTAPNAVYVPRVNPEGNIFCMDYNYDTVYFQDRRNYTQQHMDFFFENEVRWLTHFADEDFAPEIIDIDKANKIILFKWYNSSLNHLIENNEYNFTDKVNAVLQKLEKNNVLKMNFYPHTCYIDNSGNIRVHDFYACGSLNTPYIEMSKIENILGNITKFYYSRHEADGLVNLKNMYVELIEKNQGSWPECLSSSLTMY